jgi:hypothetical protein
MRGKPCKLLKPEIWQVFPIWMVNGHKGKFPIGQFQTQVPDLCCFVIFPIWEVLYPFWTLTSQTRQVHLKSRDFCHPGNARRIQPMAKTRDYSIIIELIIWPMTILINSKINSPFARCLETREIHGQSILLRQVMWLPCTREWFCSEWTTRHCPGLPLWEYLLMWPIINIWEHSRYSAA